MQGRKLNPIPLIILVLAFIGLMYFLISSKAKPTKAEDALVNKLVTATQAKIESIHPFVEVFGAVESDAVQTFSSPINSYVDAVNVQAGDEVAAKTLMIDLDTADLQIQLQGQKAQVEQIAAQVSGEELRFKSNQQALASERELLALTTTTMNNAKTLYDRGLGARNAYDQAKQQVIQLEISIQARELAVSQYNETVAQLNAQKQQIKSTMNQVYLNQKRARIVSDQAAQIVDVMVSKGERVSIGQPLVSSYTRESLQVKALVPQKYLLSLQTAKGLGETVEAVAEVNGAKVDLLLSRFSNVADMQHGGIDVYFDIVSNQERLQLNQNIPLKMNLPAESNVIALPVDALHSGGRIYRITKAHQLESVYVDVVGYTTVDDKKGKYMLVRSQELKPGDWLMTAHLTDALEGQIVDMELDGERVFAPSQEISNDNMKVGTL